MATNAARSGTSDNGLTQEERRRAIALIEELESEQRLKKDSSVSFVWKNEISYSDGFAGFDGFEESEINKLPKFNMMGLPGRMRRFGEALAESLQVSLGMVAPALLAAVALGVQKKYCAHPLPDWYEPANLYVLIVAEPSERKSPAQKEIVKPIYDFEKLENERLSPEIARYESKKKVLEAKINEAQRSLSKSAKRKEDDKYLDMADLEALQQELNELEEVTPVRILVDNVTPEALEILLEQNKENIGIMSTEGGIFNIMSGAYSNNPVIDIFLKGYSGDRFTSDRIGRKSRTLANPLVTMLLYVQPVVISEIMENSSFLGRGLDARFAYSIPQSKLGNRGYKVKKIPDDVRMEYEDLMGRLYAIQVPEKPKPIDLDKEADKLAEQFFYEVDREMLDASPEFKAWLGKLHGLSIRLALCLHCAMYIEESEFHKISGNTMRKGIEIAKYFREHAKAAFHIMGLMDPPIVRDAKYLIGKINSTGKMEMRLRDLYQLCKDRNGMETREGMIPGLNYLIERGFIRIQRGYLSQNYQNYQKGGRPSEIIYVNPEYVKWKEAKGSNAGNLD